MVLLIRKSRFLMAISLGIYPIFRQTHMDPNGCYDCFLNSPLISSMAPKNDLSSHCRAWTAKRRRSAPKPKRWTSRCTWRHQQWEVVRSLNMGSSCNMQGWGCNQQKLGVIHQETKTTKRNINGYQRISNAWAHWFHKFSRPNHLNLPN